jgi:choline dehydrogenase-like flavoprotein
MIMNVGLGVDTNMGQDIEKFLGLSPGPMSSFLKYNANNDSNFAYLAIGRPKSRGTIRLKNIDPFSDPIIDPRYFSDEGNEDMEVMIEGKYEYHDTQSLTSRSLPMHEVATNPVHLVIGLQFLTNLYENTSSYKKIGAKLAPNAFPGCEKFEIKSLEYWDCYLRTNTFTMLHPAGTCAMGRPEDKTSVVDSKLRLETDVLKIF